MKLVCRIELFPLLCGGITLFGLNLLNTEVSDSLFDDRIVFSVRRQPFRFSFQTELREIGPELRAHVRRCVHQIGLVSHSCSNLICKQVDTVWLRTWQPMILSSKSKSWSKFRVHSSSEMRVGYYDGIY